MASPGESLNSSPEYKEVTDLLAQLDEETAFKSMQDLAAHGKFKCGQNAKFEKRKKPHLSIRIADSASQEKWAKLFGCTPEERATSKVSKKSYTRKFKQAILLEFKNALHQGKFFFEIKDKGKKTAIASKSVAKQLKEQGYDRIKEIDESDFATLTLVCLKTVLSSDSAAAHISKENLSTAALTPGSAATLTQAPIVTIRTPTASKKVARQADLVRTRTTDETLEIEEEKEIEKSRKRIAETRQIDEEVERREAKDYREDEKKADARVTLDSANALPDDLRPSSAK